jgi:hypothetical protein
LKKKKGVRLGDLKGNILTGFVLGIILGESGK